RIVECLDHSLTLVAVALVDDDELELDLLALQERLDRELEGVRTVTRADEDRHRDGTAPGLIRVPRLAHVVPPLPPAPSWVPQPATAGAVASSLDSGHDQGGEVRTIDPVAVRRWRIQV